MKGLALTMAVAACSTGWAETARLNLRVWDGASWVEDYQTTAGARVRVGLFAEFENGFGFGGCVVAIEASGWEAGDEAVLEGEGLGRPFPFDAGPFSATTYLTPGLLRIDAEDDEADSPVRGLSLDQRSPVAAQRVGVPFSRDNPALLYVFEVGLSGSAARTVTFDVPMRQIKNGVLGVYASDNAYSARRDAPEPAGVARVRVPSPAGLAVLAGLVLRRRGR